MAKKKTKPGKSTPKNKPVSKKVTKAELEKKVETRKKNLKKTKFVTGKNSILIALESASFRSKKSVADAVRKCNYKSVELAPAVKMMYQQSENKAIKLSESYAKTIKDHKDNREFFQGVAQMQKKERLAVIKGYRNANQGRGVVHAMSQLPRQQCRVLMKDFVFDVKGKKDENGVKEVMYWLRDAGAQMRKIEGHTPVFLMGKPMML